MINLEKGQKISLEKEAPGVTKYDIGMGWDPRATDGQDFDLDAMAFMLNDTGKITGQQDVIFFNNLNSECGSLTHTGDNLTGDGDGDDEVIKVDLSKVPDSVQRIAFAAVIYKASERSQNFGQVSNAYIRAIVDAGSEVARFDLSEDYSTDTSVVLGELYRHNGAWKFNAMGEGRKQDLDALAASYM
ncbi:MAG: chemical-damaging agent resistance protein C [Oceanospirillaceae bacterium]|nr:chemical-damaging agent resistance protein C [Oceanospirillaceae bacterium]